MKRISKDQPTLPKAIVDSMGASQYFEVTIDSGLTVLTSVVSPQADLARAKVGSVDITEDDIKDLMALSRKAD